VRECVCMWGSASVVQDLSMGSGDQDYYLFIIYIAAICFFGGPKMKRLHHTSMSYV
jgi:hypothetical protein